MVEQLIVLFSSDQQRTMVYGMYYSVASHPNQGDPEVGDEVPCISLQGVQETPLC